MKMHDLLLQFIADGFAAKESWWRQCLLKPSAGTSEYAYWIKYTYRYIGYWFKECKNPAWVSFGENAHVHWGMLLYKSLILPFKFFDFNIKTIREIDNSSFKYSLWIC